MTPTLFITGTDTGVGKTTIAAALAAALTAEGIRVAPFKPAETGCRRSPGGLVPVDAVALREAAQRPDLPIALVCPFRYELPVAPAVAGPPPIDLATLLAAHAALSERADLVLVEGAGGLLVPYSDTLLGADLPAALHAHVLIVARASLGTINHTLLTVAEARRRSLTLLGTVLNETTEAGPDAATNAAQIRHHGAVPILGSFPRAPDLSPAALAALLHDHLPALWARVRGLALPTSRQLTQ